MVIIRTMVVSSVVYTLMVAVALKSIKVEHSVLVYVVFFFIT